MHPKSKRKVDRKLLDEYRDKPCKIMNYECHGQVVAHHVKTKGSGGEDVESNLWPLCVFHHKAVHSLGVYTFKVKYDIVDNE